MKTAFRYVWRHQPALLHGALVLTLVTAAASGVHAQDPLVRMSAIFRNSVMLTAQNLGIVGILVGFLGVIFGGHNRQEFFVWTMIAGAGIWGISAFVDTFFI